MVKKMTELGVYLKGAEDIAATIVYKSAISSIMFSLYAEMCSKGLYKLEACY